MVDILKTVEEDFADTRISNFVLAKRVGAIVRYHELVVGYPDRYFVRKLEAEIAIVPIVLVNIMIPMDIKFEEGMKLTRPWLQSSYPRKHSL